MTGKIAHPNRTVIAYTGDGATQKNLRPTMRQRAR
jgi:hypothetical protein